MELWLVLKKSYICCKKSRVIIFVSCVLLSFVFAWLFFFLENERLENDIKRRIEVFFHDRSHMTDRNTIEWPLSSGINVPIINTSMDTVENLATTFFAMSHSISGNNPSEQSINRFLTNYV